MPKLNLNISVEKECEEKLRILLKAQNIMISNLRVVGEQEYKEVNANVLGKTDTRYETLYSLYLKNCSFSN